MRSGCQQRHPNAANAAERQHMKYPQRRTMNTFQVLVDFRAHLAIEFVKAFGQVAAEHNGETSTGHPILKYQPVSETSKRACDLAEQIVAEFEDRGWIEPDSRTDVEVNTETAEATVDSWEVRDARRKLNAEQEKQAKQLVSA